MGMKEDINLLCSLVYRHTKEKELSRRVEEWLDSPSCPLTDEGEE